MSRRLTTTVRLTRDDAAALARAKTEGRPSSDLIRRGLPVVAARDDRGARRPTLGLFTSTDPRLGDEADLFAHVDDE